MTIFGHGLGELQYPKILPVRPSRAQSPLVFLTTSSSFYAVATCAHSVWRGVGIQNVLAAINVGRPEIGVGVKERLKPEP